MKNRITVSKGNNDNLHFYLISDLGKIYLFTQTFSKAVYEFFRKGRAENELKSYRGWKKNPRLDKTVEKIPMYMAYVMKEYA